MRAKLFAATISFSLLFASQANALLFNISEPNDKLTTYKESILLKGKGNGLSKLLINGTQAILGDLGSFSGAVQLHLGKNYVQVYGIDKAQRDVSEDLRILRLQEFSDLNEKRSAYHNYAKKIIENLATLGIIEGYPDNQFYAERSITRGEFATWVARALELKIAPLSQDLFVDVPKEHWRAPYIKAVIGQGIMKSYNRDLFGIDDSFSRAEAAGIVVVAEKNRKQLNNDGFSDVPETHPYREAIVHAKKMSLVKGISELPPLYDPDRDMSRQEAAIVISRFDNISDKLSELENFNSGYGEATASEVVLPLKIISVIVTPPVVSMSENNPANIRAKIESPQGRKNILSVQADLTEIGGPPDAEMKDDGKGADFVAEDQEYTLTFASSAEVTGEKRISVIATDIIGQDIKKDTSITVVK